jgi:lysophospholipase L1-like esterase
MTWTKIANSGSADPNSHTHTNKTTLDKFGESGGLPTFNGSTISGGAVDTSYMKYSGKNGYSFGDSTTNSGTDQTKNYPYYLATKLGASITNKGSSGADHNRVRNIVCGGTSSGGLTFSEPDYSNIDFVTLTMGHNGGVGSSTIADITGISEFNLYPDTFYGNFCRSIEHILSKKSNIKIYLLTPIQSTNALYKTNTANATTAIKEIGKLYALPVIDMQNTSGLHFRNLSVHTSDGTHTLSSGAQMMAELVARQMLSY